MELFTREDAVARLESLGYTWNAEAWEWVNGEVRGRLCYAPNPADVDSKEYPRIWLMRPHRQGDIPVLP